MCARNNARIYGVQDRIEFVVADFFNSDHKMQLADEIVSSPPVDMFQLKMAELIRLASRVAPKALLKLPKYTDKSGVSQQVMCYERVSILIRSFI